MTEREIAEGYAEFLESEGYRPQIDGDCDVVFKCEGRTYYISPDERDPSYFRLVFPNFWSIDGEDERIKVALAASRINARIKVVKLYLTRDDTTAAVEVFCDTPDAYKAIFSRSLGALQAAEHQFRSVMDDLE